MKFSVVVIGFNQAKNITYALDSVLTQDYQDFEVIFVDDASTDNSVEVVRSHYQDSRLKIVINESNQGPFISRLNGIDAASGDYLLFLDGDDAYAPHALKTLAARIGSLVRPADLIGFGTTLVYTGGGRPDNADDIESLMCTPCLGYLTGQELCERTYLRHDMAHVVWNKCYSMPLAKKVASLVKRDVLMYNEDFYFTFVASSSAETYYGIEDKIHLYTFGEGISTARRLDVGSIKRTMTGANAGLYCQQYAKDLGMYEPFSAVFTQNYEDVLVGAYYKLMLLPPENKLEAVQILFDTFGMDYTLSTLAKYFWYNTEVGKNINVGSLFPITRKQVKTVAMFYHRLYNGGVERVISLLSDILTQQGYQLVVITDEDVSPDDFPLPEGTVRLVIGDPDEGRNTAQRMKLWQQWVAEYNIDAVVYHAWLAPASIWDMCAIKKTGAAFITHSHNIFICGIMGGWNGIYEARHVLQHSDMLLALTEADRLYWSRFCPRVKTVTNPITFSVKNIPQAPLDNHNILWLARFDYSQKNPEHPLHIIKQVIKEVPDAKLYMVGSCDEATQEHFNRLIHQMKLDDHVIMPGYSSQVQEFYQNAAVHLMTPDYEGYGMTLTESLANGVPVVTYALPYLTRVNQSESVIQVPWRDISAAADAIIDLLKNDELRKQMGDRARTEVLQQEAYDYAGTWNSILSDVLIQVQHAAEIDSPAFLEMAEAYDLAITQMCTTVRTLQNHTVISNPSIKSLIRRKLGTLNRIRKENGLLVAIKLLLVKIGRQFRKMA